MLAATDPAREAVASAVRFQVRAFARMREGAVAGKVEAVHQLRVATRRLRAVLRLFAPVLRPGTTGHLGDEVAWLGGMIGAVRDLDVLLLAIGARGERLDQVEREALGPLVMRLRERRTAAHRELVRTLVAPRSRRLLASLDALHGGRRTVPLGTIAGELVVPFVREVERAGRRLDAEAPPAAFHRLRVRVKRLRYALETLRGLGGPGLARALKRLERLQGTLGEYQDADTQVARLRALAVEEPLPPATLFATGALAGVLGRRARRCRRRCLRRWRAFDRDLLRQVVDELSPARQGASGGAR